MKERKTEAKSEDIVLHEKRAAAEECFAQYAPHRRAGRIASVIAAAALIAPTVMLALAAYDSGDALLAVCEIVIYAALVTAADFATGSIRCKSFRYYAAMMAYRRGWRDLIRRADKLEEKALEKEAYEQDVRKIEAELSEAAEMIIDFNKR